MILIWSPHALERLAERAGACKEQVNSLVREAVRQRAWNEFWEYDPREDRGLCRNLLIKLGGSSWALVREPRNSQHTYIVASVLTQKQYEHNVAVLWHRDIEAAKDAAWRRKSPKPLTYNPFATLKTGGSK